MSGLLLFASSTWGHHVGLEQETLEEESLFMEGLDNLSEDSLGDISANFNAVITVSEDFWLNNWHKSIFLADGSVSGKGVGGLENSSL